MALIPKVNDAACGKAYAPLYSITPRMLCAGTPKGGKDSCQVNILFNDYYVSKWKDSDSGGGTI